MLISQSTPTKRKILLLKNPRLSSNKNLTGSSKNTTVKCSSFLKISRGPKTKDKLNLWKRLMNKNVNLKKISGWSGPKLRPGYKSFQSTFLLIFSLQANEVKRFKTSNGIKWRTDLEVVWFFTFKFTTDRVKIFNIVLKSGVIWNKLEGVN